MSNALTGLMRTSSSTIEKMLLIDLNFSYNFTSFEYPHSCLKYKATKVTPDLYPYTKTDRCGIYCRLFLVVKFD